MTGYSGTPLAKKLGIKPESTLVLRGAPKGWTVPDLPADVKVKTALVKQADVVVAFFNNASDIAGAIDGLAKAVFPASSVWIAWPRKAGGHKSDITDNIVRDIGLATGLVDIKVAALDDDWSALKFMWRNELR